MYGTIEYSDFYRYNKFMAIMRKKKKKLQEDDVPKIDLDESQDSSVSENSNYESINHFQSIIKVPDIKLELSSILQTEKNSA